MAQKFISSYDNYSKISTLVGALLLGYITYSLFSSHQSDESRAIYLCILFVIFFVSLFFNSGTYIITDNCLIIQRPIAPVKIPFQEILDTSIVEEGTFFIRFFGIGGFFGWYGKFWNKNIGSVTMYGRNKSTRLLIRTKTMGNIIIAPDDLSIRTLL